MADPPWPMHGGGPLRGREHFADMKAMPASKPMHYQDLAARCPSLADDATTPSGLTQCADDEGHDGPHWHINVNRSMTWES